MAFGESVTALIDTYSNCLKLLKAFNRKHSNEDELLLRKSIKSDRAKVRRAYSSRLTERGDRLEKGDKPARSALRRVLKRLTAAILNVLTLSKKQNPALDYASLMSLSNASRIDAVRAIDQLSYRLGSTSSRSSVASSAPSTKHRHQRSSGSSGSSAAPSKSSHGEAGQKKSTRASHETERSKKQGSSSSGGEKGKSRSTEHSGRTSSQIQSASSRTAVANRASMMTISTDSTKLGEIPERKWRRRDDYYYSYDDSSSSEYNAPTAYPLKPYKTPEPPKKGGFLGLFRRS